MSTLKDRLSPEQWKAYRSAVNRKYHLSEKGQAAMRRANDSPKAKERYARYRLSEKYRASQERYHGSTLWAEAAATNSRRQKVEHPERVKARSAVTIALRQGKITRPANCEACGQQRMLHAHHWAGYDQEAWLAVMWVCVPCHKRVHV